MTGGKKPRVRCAVYTRKSTEEGLDQEFNSLDAQFAACAAYVESQRHEGWELTEGRYDDGGFSGGNLNRPGLQQLLKDISAGLIDVIVVYKIDRLTRSLLDFAKIVTQLEERGASFVSITQSFNTTSSMGRLTLHILLSFAQFEREVIAERVRDKVAASKRRGMWMGGAPPYGYDGDNGRLRVNRAHAEIVNKIMLSYASLQNGRLVLADLEERAIRTRRTGSRGGIAFTRGSLFYLLNNRVYIGEIRHHGQWFPGVHEPIVPKALFERVQDLLAANAVNRNQRRGAKGLCWLSGRVFDRHGHRMRSDMTSKRGRIYRYYVAAAADRKGRRTRVPAYDLEQTIMKAISDLMTDGAALMPYFGSLHALEIENALCKARNLTLDRESVNKLVQRVDLRTQRLTIQLDGAALAKLLNVEPTDRNLTIDAPIRKIRHGKAVRLVVDGEAAKDRARNPALIRLLKRADEARALVERSPGLTIVQIAKAHGRCFSQLQRLYRVAHLDPALKILILEGRQPDSLSSQLLLCADLPHDWEIQRRSLGFVE